MGRPRKRPHAEVAEQDEPAAAAFVDASALMDANLSFLDTTSDTLSFLDLLGPEFLTQPLDVAPRPQRLSPKPHRTFPGPWHFDVADIDFDTTISDANPAPAIEPSLQEKAPSLTSPSVSTPESQTPCFHPVHAESKVCGCLASLYLALDSLQQLPSEAGPAMRVARHASKTAHDAVYCSGCSPPNYTDPHVQPPVQSFQSMMMLGTLLPTIANAYHRILSMVDEEAAEAEKDRRNLTFSLEECGGIWGRLADVDDMCDAAAHLEGAVLEPSLWRRTVRALLRIDVYGINSPGGSMEANDCKRFVLIGLKDIILLLEKRSKLRHESVDAAIAAGLVRNSEASELTLAPAGKHACQQIFEIARNSIDHLVIA